MMLNKRIKWIKFLFRIKLTSKCAVSVYMYIKLYEQYIADLNSSVLTCSVDEVDTRLRFPIRIELYEDFLIHQMRGLEDKRKVKRNASKRE